MRLIKIGEEIVKLVAVPMSNRFDRLWVGPSVAGFNLTQKCNSRCHMCHLWQSASNRAPDLTLNEIYTILKSLKDIGIQFVSFAAEGELFTRQDIVSIFEMTRALGFNFSINTNGLHIPDAFLERIHRLNPLSIIIGLDTVDPQNYAEIRGISDGLRRVKNSIQKIKDAGYHNISIGAIILANNISQLIKLADFTREHHLKAVRYTAFSPVGFGVKWDPEPLIAYQDPGFIKDLKRVIREMIQYKKKYGVVSNSVQYLKEIPTYYERGFRYFPYPCLVGYYNIQIMADGTVPVCSYRGPAAVLGNAKNTPLINLLRSQKAMEERIKIKRKKCPNCFMSCFVENNMRFSLKQMVPSNIEVYQRSRKLGLL